MKWETGQVNSEEKIPIVQMYTDGGCIPNPGKGAWAVILTYGDKEKVLTGFEEDTTNNRMELKSAIEGLRALKRKCKVTIFTDSQYLKKGISEWIHHWKENG